VKHNQVAGTCVSTVQRRNRQENEGGEQATVMSQNMFEKMAGFWHLLISLAFIKALMAMVCLPSAS
jgi:hypothetical protein